MEIAILELHQNKKLATAPNYVVDEEINCIGFEGAWDTVTIVKDRLHGITMLFLRL